MTSRILTLLNRLGPGASGAFGCPGRANFLFFLGALASLLLLLCPWSLVCPRLTPSPLTALTRTGPRCLARSRSDKRNPPPLPLPLLLRIVMHWSCDRPHSGRASRHGRVAARFTVHAAMVSVALCTAMSPWPSVSAYGARMAAMNKGLDSHAVRAAVSTSVTDVVCAQTSSVTMHRRAALQRRHPDAKLFLGLSYCIQF